MAHELPVLAAMKAVLDGDATLAALMGGTARVYDDPPDDAVEPFLWCAVLSGDEFDTKTTNGTMVRCEWGVASAYKGKKEAQQILDRVEALFHRQTLGLTGRNEIFMQWNGTKAVVHDGASQTHYGRIGFRLFVQDA